MKKFLDAPPCKNNKQQQEMYLYASMLEVKLMRNKLFLLIYMH